MCGLSQSESARGRVRAVVGLQWGDEGKGKLVDVLSEDVDIVARYQGGANAGHTLKVGDTTYVGHLVPSGILRDDVVCLIGNGVVIDPATLLEEIGQLAELGVSVEGRLRVSSRAHLVLPYHKARERLIDAISKLGTTGRGIGPAYADKAGRGGVRVGDLLDPEHLAARVASGVEATRRLAGGELPPELAPLVDEPQIMADLARYAEVLRPFICDTVSELNTRLQGGASILLEGAQGVLLDIDYGTYPYVTSSNCSVAGACTGVGLAPRFLDEVVGICKAYTTRVGEGPFPSELTDEVGARLAKRGHEFGSTTGRPRRCGWLDLVALKYAVALNGIDAIALTKLDVLSGEDELCVVVAYEIDGEQTETFPASIRELERARPVLMRLPGWQQPIEQARSPEDLPASAREYIALIERETGVPLRWISVGPERSQILTREAAERAALR